MLPVGVEKKKKTLRRASKLKVDPVVELAGGCRGKLSARHHSSGICEARAGRWSLKRDIQLLFFLTSKRRLWRRAGGRAVWRGERRNPVSTSRKERALLGVAG